MWRPVRSRLGPQPASSRKHQKRRLFSLHTPTFGARLKPFNRSTPMRIYHTVALAILAGAALGGTAIQGLNAQGTAPGAYVIVDITQINDPTNFKTLLPKAAQTVAEFGGHFVTRTDKITGLDG